MRNGACDKHEYGQLTTPDDIVAVSMPTVKLPGATVAPSTVVAVNTVVKSQFRSQPAGESLSQLAAAPPSTPVEFVPADVVCLSPTSAWVSSPDSEARRSEKREERRWGQQHARSLRARLLTLGGSPGVGDVAIAGKGAMWTWSRRKRGGGGG